jgi:hypothetical protein
MGNQLAVYNRSWGEHLTVPVHIIGPNIPGSTELFHVHAEGCADIHRRAIYGAFTADEKEEFYEVTSKRGLAEWAYPPDDFDYDPDTEWRTYFDGQFKVFPCVKGTIPDEPIAKEEP